MDKIKPTIYLLHGDDHLGMRDFVETLISRMGDPAMAQMNISRLNAAIDSVKEIESACMALPIFSDRRLVIVKDAKEWIRTQSGSTPGMGRKGKGGSERPDTLIGFLEAVPTTTALVLLLEDEWVKEKGTWGWKMIPAEHGVIDWAISHPGKGFYRCFSLPRGREMSGWIMKKAVELGGQITTEAAQTLALSTGNDTELGARELEKLLSFVDYRRAIGLKDVESLTIPVVEEDVFAMADAIGRRDARNALKSLHGLLLQALPEEMMGMVIRQIRLLLIVKEAMQEGNGLAEISGMIRLPPGITQKYMEQAKGFGLDDLIVIYQRLLEIDEANKTGRVPIEIALDTWMVSLATSKN